MTAVESLGGGVVVANPLTSNWWVDVDGVVVTNPPSRMWMVDSGTVTVYNGVSTGQVTVAAWSTELAVERGMSALINPITLGLFALVVVVLLVRLGMRSGGGRVD